MPPQGSSTSHAPGCFWAGMGCVGALVLVCFVAPSGNLLRGSSRTDARHGGVHAPAMGVSSSSSLSALPWRHPGNTRHAAKVDKRTSLSACDPTQWPTDRARAAVASACANVSSRCGDCCTNQATRSGARIEAFRRILMDTDTSNTINISVVGNSVARQNDFATTRLFVDALRQVAPLGRQFAIQHRAVAGGFEPKHLMQCGAAASELSSAHVVVVEWSSPTGPEAKLDTAFEQLIRQFIALPQQPLIVYISHCTLADFSYDADWAAHPGRKTVGEPDGYWETMRVYERKLAALYNLPFVDTCAAFKSFLAGYTTCNDVSPGMILNRSTDLIPLFAPDYLHQNELGNELQSCLVAQTVLGGPPCDETSRDLLNPLPDRQGKGLLEALGPTGQPFVSLTEDNTSTQAVFCMSARDGTLSLDPAGKASGWIQRVGGAGGQKVWLSSNTSGARFATRTPRPATHYKVELYAHHDLPLGLVRVIVNGSITDIDPCCPAPQCAGTLQGRGLYKGFRVPHVGEFPLAAHPIEFQVIERPNGTASVCAVAGNDVSLAGMIGFVS
eukprot:m.43511 g.43511  ORF g.43511 m.43511 type:complete len:557 (+) comp6419_c0_seq1:511-2181(+)